MFKKIGAWYSLAETKKSLIFWHIIFTIIRVVTWIISPIFAAKVTVALMDGEYTMAIVNLAIELIIIVIGFVAWDLVYRNAGTIFRNTYSNVQKKIYRKAYRAKTSNFKTTSKEKLLNIIGTDIEVVSNFGDTLGVRIGRIVQVVVTMIIVFISNWVVGLAILGVSTLNFVVLLKLNKNIAKKKSILYENKDKIYEKFTKVLNDQDIIKEYNIGPEYYNMYFDGVNKYSKSYAKHKNACSIKDNYFISGYKTLIFLITVFMIFLVKNNTLTLTLYFTLVPYLLTSVELINEIINISASIEETDVSAKRINTVLNFTDEEFVKYGTLTQYTHKDNLALMNVSYKNTDKDSPYYGNLKSVDMSFKYGTLNLIQGPRNSGKRIVFNLLSRRIAPQEGIILLNDINILDYDIKTYKSELSTTTSKPPFTNNSIMENLEIVEKNKDRIYEVCEHFGLKEVIDALPNGFDTNIFDAKLSSLNMFLLGLSMAYMTNSSAICIYEIPTGLSDSELTTLKETFLDLMKEKTILLFSHSETFGDIAGLTYKIAAGKIVDRIEK